MPHTFHNDQPVLEDSLARAAIVASIARVAATCQPPTVLGVHGDWGLGKTSLLHQLYCALSGECPTKKPIEPEVRKRLQDQLQDMDLSGVAVVWFEAWRYQHEAQPVVALIHAIRNQLTWYKKLGRSTRKVSESAVVAALKMNKVTEMIGVSSTNAEQALKDWEAANLDTATSHDSVRKLLHEAIAGLLPGHRPAKLDDDHRRVVVIIDDLDRCDPEGAYQLLEGLKLYLSIPNCVFVLGMNQTVVEDAIGTVVPGGDGDVQFRKERAGAYLEKLCANIWRVPPVTDPIAYLTCLMPDTVFRRWLPMALTLNGVPLHCLPRNPRRIKALANLLLRTGMPEGMTGQPGADGVDEQLRLQEVRSTLAVALVYQFHHDLFRYWQAHPELYDDYIKAWCLRGNLTSPPQERSAVEEILATLRLPVKVTPTDGEEGTVYAMSTSYPDPADTGVFWAQPLFVALEQESGGALTPETFLTLFGRYHGAG